MANYAAAIEEQSFQHLQSIHKQLTQFSQLEPRIDALNADNTYHMGLVRDATAVLPEIQHRRGKFLGKYAEDVSIVDDKFANIHESLKDKVWFADLDKGGKKKKSLRDAKGKLGLGKAGAKSGFLAQLQALRAQEAGAGASTSGQALKDGGSKPLQSLRRASQTVLGAGLAARALGGIPEGAEPGLDSKEERERKAEKFKGKAAGNILAALKAARAVRKFKEHVEKASEAVESLGEVQRLLRELKAAREGVEGARKEVERAEMIAREDKERLDGLRKSAAALEERAKGREELAAQLEADGADPWEVEEALAMARQLRTSAEKRQREIRSLEEKLAASEAAAAAANATLRDAEGRVRALGEAHRAALIAAESDPDVLRMKSEAEEARRFMEASALGAEALKLSEEAHSLQARLEAAIKFAEGRKVLLDAAAAEEAGLVAARGGAAEEAEVARAQADQRKEIFEQLEDALSKRHVKDPLEEAQLAAARVTHVEWDRKATAREAQVAEYDGKVAEAAGVREACHRDWEAAMDKVRALQKALANVDLVAEEAQQRHVGFVSEQLSAEAEVAAAAAAARAAAFGDPRAALESARAAVQQQVDQAVADAAWYRERAAEAAAATRKARDDEAAAAAAVRRARDAVADADAALFAARGELAEAQAQLSEMHEDLAALEAAGRTEEATALKLRIAEMEGRVQALEARVAECEEALEAARAAAKEAAAAHAKAIARVEEARTASLAADASSRDADARLEQVRKVAAAARAAAESAASRELSAAEVALAAAGAAAGAERAAADGLGAEAAEAAMAVEDARYNLAEKSRQLSESTRALDVARTDSTRLLAAADAAEAEAEAADSEVQACIAAGETEKAMLAMQAVGRFRETARAKRSASMRALDKVRALEAKQDSLREEEVAALEELGRAESAHGELVARAGTAEQRAVSAEGRARLAAVDVDGTRDAIEAADQGEAAAAAAREAGRAALEIKLDAAGAWAARETQAVDDALEALALAAGARAAADLSLERAAAKASRADLARERAERHKEDLSAEAVAVAAALDRGELPPEEEERMRAEGEVREAEGEELRGAVRRARAAHEKLVARLMALQQRAEQRHRARAGLVDALVLAEHSVPLARGAIGSTERAAAEEAEARAAAARVAVEDEDAAVAEIEAKVSALEDEVEAAGLSLGLVEMDLARAERAAATAETLLASGALGGDEAKRLLELRLRDLEAMASAGRGEAAAAAARAATAAAARVVKGEEAREADTEYRARDKALKAAERREREAFSLLQAARLEHSVAGILEAPEEDKVEPEVAHARGLVDVAEEDLAAAASAVERAEARVEAARGGVEAARLAEEEALEEVRRERLYVLKKRRVADSADARARAAQAEAAHSLFSGAGEEAAEAAEAAAAAALDVAAAARAAVERAEGGLDALEAEAMAASEARASAQERLACFERDLKARLRALEAARRALAEAQESVTTVTREVAAINAREGKKKAQDEAARKRYIQARGRIGDADAQQRAEYREEQENAEIREAFEEDWDRSVLSFLETCSAQRDALKRRHAREVVHLDAWSEAWASCHWHRHRHKKGKYVEQLMKAYQVNVYRGGGDGLRPEEAIFAVNPRLPYGPKDKAPYDMYPPPKKDMSGLVGKVPELVPDKPPQVARREMGQRHAGELREMEAVVARKKATMQEGKEKTFRQFRAKFLKRRAKVSLSVGIYAKRWMRKVLTRRRKRQLEGNMDWLGEDPGDFEVFSDIFGSKPSSAAHGSRAGGSRQSSRQGSGPSRPGSRAGGSRQGSGPSRPGSRVGGSRPGSRAGGSKAPSAGGSRPGSVVGGSRPGSVVGRDRPDSVAGSRPSSVAGGFLGMGHL